ncbi:MAG: hypothetical protein EA402_08760 [Planctomycetota bacterium]|nr:MAG: hypothetical protein EA402_08760 [Planctomycetota bacterium]
MRWLPLVWLCLLAGPVHVPGAEHWSGEVIIVELFERPRPNQQDGEQLEDLLDILADRLLLRQQQRDLAADPERRVIERDILALEQDQREVQELLAGQHELSRTRFLLSRAPLGADRSAATLGTRARADIDGAVLVAHWSEGLLRGRDRWGRFEGALPLVVIRPRSIPDATGENWHEAPTRRLRLRDGEMLWEIDFRPDLPNPWAAIITNDLDERSHPVLFASVPGLPVRVRRELGQSSQLIFLVVGLSEVEAFEEGTFANP